MKTKNSKTQARKQKEDLLIMEKYLELGFTHIVDISTWYEKYLFPINGLVHKNIYKCIACEKKGKYYRVSLVMCINIKKIVWYKTVKTIISSDEYWRLHQKYGGILDQIAVNLYNHENKIPVTIGSSS